jgi:hypothetical protein
MGADNRYQELLDEELDKLTRQRVRQIWSRTDIRNKFKIYIMIPGIRSLITMGSLKYLLKLRIFDMSI